MTPHLAERLFRWHLNITSDCTEQVNKIHSQQVSKELEVIRLIWVLSHLYRLSLYSSIKYTISLKKREQETLFCLPEPLELLGLARREHAGPLVCFLHPWGTAAGSKLGADYALARLFPLVGESR